jgi:UDP-N-acetylmuramate--alanine ligase
MTALIAEKTGLDPTVVIGTKIKEFKNKNFRTGKGKYLIIEACEYKKSFLNFYPQILVITNIEADHLDYYKTFENYKKAFELLINKIPKTGKIIISDKDKIAKELTKKAKAEVVSWKKLPEAIELNFSSTKNKKIVHEIDINLGIPGEFNVSNATAAATVGLLLSNTQTKKIEKTIKSFKGTWRRMEYKKKKNMKCKFIDDYGHHPTAVELTLNAIREKHPKEKILCIFQPHQYSRTRIFLKEFGESFGTVNKIIIPDIYNARDSKEDIKSISVDDLVAEIKKHNKNVTNGKGLKNTAEYIKKNHAKYDIIVTMGAGDISNIYKMF